MLLCFFFVLLLSWLMFVGGLAEFVEAFLVTHAQMVLQDLCKVWKCVVWLLVWILSTALGLVGLFTNILPCWPNESREFVMHP